MTLTIQTEQDEQRQLLMTIEVPEERVKKQMRLTARKLARDANIPGFRRGKAPYHVIVSRVGQQALRSEAIEELLQPVFEEAMEEISPDIYAPAQFDDMEIDPLVLKFTVPLTPEVELGDYRALRKEIEPVNVTDEAVAEALENIQTRHQELEDVDRPIQAGDLIAISGKGELIIDEVEADSDEDDTDKAEETDEAAETANEAETDTVLFDTERLELIMDSSKLFPGTDFVDNIIGLALGESKSFNVTFPEDFEDEELAGKEATFNIEILQVQKRILPDLDDALAETEGHQSLEEMRNKTRENLVEAAEAQAKNDLIEAMIDDVLEISTMVYPPAAVEVEIDNRLESFKNQVTRSGWEWEDFLKLQSNTEADLREEFRESATEAVERQLILREIILAEKLTIKDEDVDAKIDERVAAFGDNETLANSMRDFYKQGAGFDSISSEILMDKVAERIEAILSGKAPDLAELEAAEAEEDDEIEATSAETVSEEETASEETTEGSETETEAESVEPEVVAEAVEEAENENDKEAEEE